MAEAPERDRMEPPGVSTGRVLVAVGLVFTVLFITFTAVAVFSWKRLRGAPEARARAFPVPALETSVEPRTTADRGHGPKPYREPPVAARSGQPPPADPRLEAAMRAVAARGAAAYDPVPGAGR